MGTNGLIAEKPNRIFCYHGTISPYAQSSLMRQSTYESRLAPKFPDLETNFELNFLGSMRRTIFNCRRIGRSGPFQSYFDHILTVPFWKHIERALVVDTMLVKAGK